MSNNSGECIRNEFENYLKTNGIEHRLSIPCCSQQMGVAESKNHTLVEMAHCLLSRSQLPLYLQSRAD